MPDPIVYRVMTAAEPQQMQRDGVFHGSSVDRADGYIHLSCGSQLAATLDRHFSGVEGLMLVAVDLARLGDTVRWEPARGGELFPHIYGRLPVESVISVAAVERSADGAVKLHTSGECEIDVARRELRVLGSPVPVGGRAFQFIEVLVGCFGFRPEPLGRA